MKGNYEIFQKQIGNFGAKTADWSVLDNNFENPILSPISDI